DMFFNYPFIGVGNGLFEMFYPFYQGKYLVTEIFGAYRTHANNAHNEILELVSQVGIVGFSIFVWLMISIYQYLINGYRNAASKAAKIELAAILASITAMLVDNMLNVSLHFTVPMMVFWFIVGVGIMKVEDFDAAKYFIEIKLNIVRKALIVVSIILLASIAFAQTRFFIADMNYFKGFKIIKTKRSYELTTDLLHLARYYFNRAKKFHKYEINNLYELGNTYVKLNMYKEAEEIFKLAIKANPGYDEIYYNLGIILSNLQRYDEAEKYLKISRSINSISLPTLYALGNVYLNSPDDYEKAIEVFESSLTLKTDNANAYNNLGYLYSKTRDFERAKKAYQKALKIDPTKEEIKRNLRILEQKGV
ncbi:tetratricopeptide repeat protein, partial [bacterium]